MNNSGTHINRTNYEEYFLLFIDDELTPEQRASLNEFIRLNPDLEKELQALCGFTLKPDESITFTEKETLMHFTMHDDNIHPGNIEDYFILYADNELSNAQKAAVEEFVYHHPRYQSEFELILSARLAPDRRLVFDHKEKLFRSEGKVRTILLYRRWLSAAACVLLLCGGIWLSRQAFVSTPAVKLTHSGQVKKPMHINRQAQQTVTARKESPVKETMQDSPPAIALNEDRLTRHAARPLAKDKNTSREGSGHTNKPVDPAHSRTLVFTGKLIKPVPGKEIDMPVPDELKPVQSEPATSTEYNEDPEMTDSQVLLVNDQTSHSPIHPFNKKQLIRGIFRKATRLLDHQSSIRNTEPAGLRIGNIEISIQ